MVMFLHRIDDKCDGLILPLLIIPFLDGDSPLSGTYRVHMLIWMVIFFLDFIINILN